MTPHKAAMQPLLVVAVLAPWLSGVTADCIDYGGGGSSCCYVVWDYCSQDSDCLNSTSYYAIGSPASRYYVKCISSLDYCLYYTPSVTCDPYNTFGYGTCPTKGVCWELWNAEPPPPPSRANPSNRSPPPPPDRGYSSSSTGSESNAGAIAGIVTGVVVLIAIIASSIVGCIVCCRHRARSRQALPPSPPAAVVTLAPVSGAYLDKSPWLPRHAPTGGLVAPVPVYAGKPWEGEPQQQYVAYPAAYPTTAGSTELQMQPMSEQGKARINMGSYSTTTTPLHSTLPQPSTGLTSMGSSALERTAASSATTTQLDRAAAQPFSGAGSGSSTAMGMAPGVGPGLAIQVPTVISHTGASTASREASLPAHSPTPSNIVRAQALAKLRIKWSQLELGAVVGEGGFGKVHIAKWQGNRVAVKVLNLERVGEEERVSLYREALIMAELFHPSIARIYGVVDEPPHHALVMQYYKKGTLATHMLSSAYRNSPLSLKLNLALQVASGMQFMHEKEPPILHGDLKTSNLLLEDTGTRLVIADFGLSHLLQHSGAQAGEREGHRGALTLSISPPEVLLDPMAPRTPAADVYAFGMVLLEIMTGQAAFTGLRPSQLKSLVVAGNRPNILATVPPVIAAIITDCWHQEAARRPSFATVTQHLFEAYEELQIQMTGGDVTRAVGNTTTAYGW